MKTEWIMILTIGYAGDPRACLTAPGTVDIAVDEAIEALCADGDAERVHVLRSTPLKSGLRSWHTVVTLRRPRSGEAKQTGEFVCVLDERLSLERQQQLQLQ